MSRKRDLAILNVPGEEWTIRKQARFGSQVRLTVMRTKFTS